MSPRCALPSSFEERVCVSECVCAGGGGVSEKGGPFPLSGCWGVKSWTVFSVLRSVVPSSMASSFFETKLWRSSAVLVGF